MLDERIRARIGTVLGRRYRLERVIGAGGMGAVYAAAGEGGEPVAVKVLHADERMSSDLRARFLREGWVANRVGHEGVVRVIDGGTEEDGTAYIVMELLEGESLAAYWERQNKQLPVGQVVAIARRLLDVLAAAHEKGIVHRDVKPDNVFVTTEGEVKVLDFGVARVVNGTKGTTTTGATLGTPAFMAKEQALGLNRSIDERTDVWAVGAVMFTLLTGRYVHDDAENGAQMMVFAATRPAPRLQSLAPQVPDAVAAVVDRALAFEKEDRWPSAGVMREALDAAGVARASITSTPPRANDAAAVAPTMASPIGFRALLTSIRTRRRRWMVALVGAVVLALGLLAVIGITVARRSSIPQAAAATTGSPASSEVDVLASATDSPPAPPLPAASAAPAHHRPKSAPTRAKPKSCDPPWIIDADGVRVFKRECL